MKSTRFACCAICSCFLAVSLTSSVFAADKQGAEQRRLQQQLRAAEKEKSQLTQQKAEVEKQLTEMQDKFAGAGKKAAAAARRNAELQKQLDAMKQDNDALTNGLAAAEQKLADAERALAEAKRGAETQARAFGEEKKRMEAAYAGLSQALTGSRERNERMYKLGFELIARYESKSCFTSALQAEPLTGLKRAQIEKMAEEDREKFDKDRLPPPVPQAQSLPLPPPPSPDSGAIGFDGTLPAK